MTEGRYNSQRWLMQYARNHSECVSKVWARSEGGGVENNNNNAENSRLYHEHFRPRGDLAPGICAGLPVSICPLKDNTKR
jgi:hypothetical protein